VKFGDEIVRVEVRLGDEIVRDGSVLVGVNFVCFSLYLCNVLFLFSFVFIFTFLTRCNTTRNR
jgi:hypothetical protein